MKRRSLLALAACLLALPRPTVAWPAPKPLRRLCLANPHTGETFDGPFRDDIGPITQAIADLSEFLRDHHSGEKTAIDIDVLDFLASVMDAVGATRATVLSAYRTRESNAMLARTTFGVAENKPAHLWARARRSATHAQRRGDAHRARPAAGRGWLVPALWLPPY
jgi:uncharacterized protein YcbK (DUF882 family)